MQQKTVFLEHSCEGLVAWRDALRHAQAEKDKASFEQRKDEWAEERRLRKEAAQAITPSSGSTLRRLSVRNARSGSVSVATT